MANNDWVIVPKEPTTEMLLKGCEAGLSLDALLDDGRFACERRQWGAMIAAAPVEFGNVSELIKERNAAVGQWNNAQASWMYEKGQLEAEMSAMRTMRDVAITELKALYAAYVRMLESSRNRIIDLGGNCDPVSRMEDGDPALISARALIAATKVPTAFAKGPPKS